jgi:hypothetical protein
LPAERRDEGRQLVCYPSEDYDATSDDIAFPQEWFAALEWELTLRCAPYATATGIARELNPDNSDAHFQPGRD